jgi:hypothetical protein
MFFKKLHGGVQKCEDPFHAFKFNSAFFVKVKILKGAFSSEHSSMKCMV